MRTFMLSEFSYLHFLHYLSGFQWIVCGQLVDSELEHPLDVTVLVHGPCVHAHAVLAGESVPFLI